MSCAPGQIKCDAPATRNAACNRASGALAERSRFDPRGPRSDERAWRVEFINSDRPRGVAPERGDEGSFMNGGAATARAHSSLGDASTERRGSSTIPYDWKIDGGFGGADRPLNLDLEGESRVASTPDL